MYVKQKGNKHLHLQTITYVCKTERQQTPSPTDNYIYMWNRKATNTFTYPLTAEGVGAPQMTSQSVSFIFFCSPLPAFWYSVNSRPVHSLMLSFHLFFCLPCLLPPFIVPCKMVLVKSGEQETCPHHFSLRLFYDGQVFMWSDCLLDLGTDFLVGGTVFVQHA